MCFQITQKTLNRYKQDQQAFCLLTNTVQLKSYIIVTENSILSYITLKLCIWFLFRFYTAVKLGTIALFKDNLLSKSKYFFKHKC